MAGRANRIGLMAIQGRAVLARAVDVVFPARCAGCGHRGVWICDECLPKLAKLEPPWCARCGIPLNARCRCDHLSASIAMSRSASLYGGWMRRAIHLLKYESEPARAESLARFLTEPAGGFPSFDMLVPTPLHRSRQRRRGYNQAELLATFLSQDIDQPVIDCLVRTKSTPQQVGLDAEARRRNVSGAFSVEDPARVGGKRILLIDDVMTTGSTLNACADALVAAGAAWVGVLTLAREI